MERNSLNNEEDSGVGGKNLRGNTSSSNKIKNSRDYNNHCFEEDFLGRFSWPPRSYTCSFCKREFRSAQALGGHMNVHRRDRARLRQSPPWDGSCPNPSPNPNPNPNLSSSSPTRVPPITYAFPSLPSSSTTCLSSHTSVSSGDVKTSVMEDSPLDPSSSRGGDHRKMKTLKALYEIGELEGFRQEDDQCKILKKAEIVGLDLELEIGLDRDLKEDLDLELRLGCS